ncbi:MAG TPA: 5-amino-6-(D-ribitylamino)uracil--L-tyrosine 4-hydroxyphenyl transferase CofH [Terriglobales bacterium]|nr:5-amino-6-(D-ribitylamino)uracil--L-tyrosine 4-hydroxyphenyl transferase CofH [Terriglobales bacterium]
MQILPHPWNSTAVWNQLSPHISPQVRQPLERLLECSNGSTLSREDCLALAQTTGDELLALAAVADILRERLVGDKITYVVNRNINFTNVCFVGCKFCAFHHGPNHPEANSFTPEQVAEKAMEAWELGATEVCIQGGLPRNLPPFYYRDVLRAIKSALPKMHIHAFSPMEITYGVQLTGMDLRDYLSMLRDNGLDTMPGTAAEILHDDVRSLISKYKLNAESWEEIIRTAHECGIRTTSTMMYGHVEKPEHWVDQLLMFRSIQSDTGGFTEFVPLGFIHNNTRLFLEGHSRPGPTPEEHIRIHALARVLLAGAINNIQVSWVKMPREMSQQCFQAGANDHGGTLMEENISRTAGASFGQYLSPEQFDERIRELGRTPAQRNTTYSQITPRPAVMDAIAQ